MEKYSWKGEARSISVLDPMKRPFLAIAAFVLLLLSGARGLSDGGDAARFPFLTPRDDAAANFGDVGSLNDGPAGSHGFIAVRDSHFVEGDTGRRVRFLGTNIALDGLFPAHDDAEKPAAHLANYGIDAVRFDTARHVTDAPAARPFPSPARRRARPLGRAVRSVHVGRWSSPASGILALSISGIG